MTLAVLTNFPVLSYFLSEVVLFFVLPAVIVLPVFLGRGSASRYVAVVDRKKHFFVSLRLTQFILLGVLLIDFFFLRPLVAADISVGEPILFHAGNFFFRQDVFIWFVNFFLTGLTLYYTYLVAMVFSRTSAVVSYVSEIPALLLCVLLSLRLFMATNDLILIIILLEIASFCSIIYIGMQSMSSTSYSLAVEAAIKYFIINAFAVALLLVAISGYFYLTMSTHLGEIVAFFYTYPFLSVFFFEQLIFVQLLFFFAYLIKLGAAPLHQWVPDVYEGAETLVTCFLVLLISPVLMFKGLVFFKMLTAVPASYGLVRWLVFGAGALSVLVGTFCAFYQTRIKRFLAYAGVTHLGFMLLGLCFNSFLGYFAFVFYLVIYVLTNICFFTFLLFSQHFLATRTRLVYINQLRHYVQQSLFFLVCVIVCLFSFAGIPPFAGFFAKFFVLGVLVQQSQFALVAFLIFSILVGTFAYLRFLKITLFETSEAGWMFTVRSVFSVFPKTVVAVFADYTVRLKQTAVAYRVVDTWQRWLLAGVLWFGGFLSFFFFFFSVYSLGIAELVVTLLAYY